VTQPIRIMHIITGLASGGAEMMLYKLLGAMQRDRFANSVVSLTDEGVMGERIRALGIPVRALGMKAGIPNPWALLRLVGWIRHDGIQLVQCWMYHADLVGGIAARWAGVPVLWGIRQSNFDGSASKQSTMRVMRWCARLSNSIPTRIISCSETGRTVHEQQAYASTKMVVIPNGFQTDVFRCDGISREQVRGELGIPVAAPVVGIVGRYDPQKDYHTFIKAAAKLQKNIPDVHFIICGKDLTRDNPMLMAWIDEAGIADCCSLLGQRNDLHRLYCAMDIVVSSSAYGEGFPNVIGEAMACGVPCVVTDVGDSAVIVGDSGRVVPPRHPDALAQGVLELLSLPETERRRLGEAARQRIETHYSLPAIAARYEALYEEVLAQCVA
jgi:glycosyltransferase involved in cell wall biosynthesis